MAHRLTGSRLWLVICLGLAVLYEPTSSLNLTPFSGAKPRCNGISRGTHFVLGFLENHSTNSEFRQLYILVVAFSEHQTNVTVSSKHPIGGAPFEETFSLEAGGFRRLVLPAELMMEGIGKNKKAIDVSATHEVSVYGLMYQDYTTDGFLGIPTVHLGKEYIVATGIHVTNLPTQFSVIASEDSTSVNVVLRAPLTFEGRNYGAGDVLNFTLDNLEAVHLQTMDEADITGSIVQSDRPVAVFGGNVCEFNPSSTCDTLLEQLVPVRSWGQRHVYTAASPADRNGYRVVAYFADTEVAVPGTDNLTLNTGEFWQGSLYGSGLVVSSKPTVMMQQLENVNGEVLDPSLIQVPAVEHFGYIFGFTTPPYSGDDSSGFFNFINIVVKRSARQYVYLNRSPIPGTDVVETDVPGTDYVSLTVELLKGEGVYFVQQSNRSSGPLSVVAYGYEHDESYGYAAGLSLPVNTQLLSLSPYYLRELGGQEFMITVPCLETNAVISPYDAMCKFATLYGDVLVKGMIDSYTAVCMTPPFYQNGLITVEASLDDGKTFPYSGVVYVASEEDLAPLVTARQANSEEGSGIINTNSLDPILLSWDPSSAGFGISRVTVMAQDSGYNSDGNPVLNEGVVLKADIPNNGSVTLLSSELRQALPGSGISLMAFYLTPSGMRKRRSIFGDIVSLTRRVYSGVKRLVREVLDLPCTAFDDVLADVPTGLGPCPCTSQQAAIDALNFVSANFLNSFFHPGAKECYRSTSSSDAGSGQQCCYRADGNISFGPPGGGTADRYGPGDHFWAHQWYDVLPWLGCCKLSNNCDKYYAHRRSDDCSNYIPPRPAGGTGDPHITSLDGKRFTFNGAGEFLMASSALHNLTFQARMEKFRNTDASVYTSFVLQAGESPRVQVQMSRSEETLVLVDSKPLDFTSIPVRVHHLRGLRVEASADRSEVRLAFKAGLAVIVYIDPEVMSFIAQLDSKFKGRVMGLLGNLDGDPDNDLRFPNGTELSTNASLRELHELGLGWLVAREDSFFTYIPPRDYSSYHFPDFKPTLEVPDVNAVSQDVKELCGESVECLFDAVVTGSLSFANKTKQVSTDLIEIQKASVTIVSCGFPGVVENGATFGSVYLVNDTVRASCGDGFKLVGSSQLTCRADGQWSAELPSCVSTASGSARPSSHPLALTAMMSGWLISAVFMTS